MLRRLPEGQPGGDGSRRGRESQAGTPDPGPSTLARLHDRVPARPGMPEEADQSFADIDRQLPYGLALDHSGRGRVEAFKRRLVTPYRETDFWHESDKRLAVVRQSVTKEAWRELMSDRSAAGRRGQS